MYGMCMCRICVWVESQSIVWVSDEHVAGDSPKVGGVIIATPREAHACDGRPPRSRHYVCRLQVVCRVWVWVWVQGQNIVWVSDEHVAE